MFHHTRNSPAPHVTVLNITYVNSMPNPMMAIDFQIAVPKSMQCKLFQPSSKDLPAYSLTKGPTAVTQILLVSNPTKAPLRLRYRLSYSYNNALVQENGEISKL
eukprot:Colp12_sorted_trinity150504_noHs@13183